MKLSLDFFKDLDDEDFRVLLAIERASKTKEAVFFKQIKEASGLLHPMDSLSRLAGLKLIKRERNAQLQLSGFLLSYNGHDYLALRSLVVKNVISSFGASIGIGKESDIYTVLSPEGIEMVAKIHRLGRPSFKTVKKKRDYGNMQARASWMQLSRLSAEKEYTWMLELHTKGFPIPKPISHNRHIIVMEKIAGIPLYKLRVLEDAEEVYRYLIGIIVRLAKHGLVHGDFNEFNILLGPELAVTFIDFPQMVSSSHPNASELFNRDVECIQKWFRKQYGYEGNECPKFEALIGTKTL